VPPKKRSNDKGQHGDTWLYSQLLGKWKQEGRCLKGWPRQKCKTLSEKQTKSKKGKGMVQVVEHLQPRVQTPVIHTNTFTKRVKMTWT
jgi:hypothetical protein